MVTPTQGAAHATGRREWSGDERRNVRSFDGSAVGWRTHSDRRRHLADDVWNWFINRRGQCSIIYKLPSHARNARYVTLRSSQMLAARAPTSSLRTRARARRGTADHQRRAVVQAPHVPTACVWSHGRLQCAFRRITADGRPIKSDVVSSKRHKSNDVLT